MMDAVCVSMEYTPLICLIQLPFTPDIIPSYSFERIVALLYRTDFTDQQLQCCTSDDDAISVKLPHNPYIQWILNLCKFN